MIWFGLVWSGLVSACTATTTSSLLLLETPRRTTTTTTTSIATIVEVVVVEETAVMAMENVPCKEVKVSYMQRGQID